MKTFTEWFEKKGMFYIILSFIFIIFYYIYRNLFLGKNMFTHDSFYWVGSFYYYVDSLANGSYPLWDPYMLTGTYFYPNIHAHGLLDPITFLSIFMVKVLGTSILTAYTYFYLLRLFVFFIGAYYLFKIVSKCSLSAVLSAGVLLFAVAPTAFMQMGILEHVFLTPFTLFFILKIIENIREDKKYLYLACLALGIGISLNISVPAFFTFNLTVFVVTLLLMGFFRWNDLKYFASDKRFIAFSSAVLFLVILMTAPPFTLFMESIDPKGELFPSVRIIQKNRGMFKKIVASDISDNVLSPKFTNHLGVYSSYGNVLSLLYPDLWRYLFVSDSFERKQFRYKDFISEAYQYIGIIPFIISIIGFIYSKSHYRYLAAIMLVVISINMLSTYGVHSRPPNIVQSLFNRAFPLLRTQEVREVLSGFFLLYLCLLLSLGLKIFFERKELIDIIGSRNKGIFILIAAVIVAKIVVSWYFFNSIVYISFVDIIAILTIIAFGCWIYLYHKQKFGQMLFQSVILAVIFADIFYYNHSMRPYIVQHNWLGPLLSTQKKNEAQENAFQFFRIPFVLINNGQLAFSESMFKIKGAMSHGDNHHMLTTKRYYDYLTHVPLENQFVLSGISYPVIRFFPENMVKIFKDRREILDYFTKARENELSHFIFIESEDASVNTYKDNNIFKGISQFEDAVWLSQENIIRSFQEYTLKNRTKLGKNFNILENLNGKDYRIDVKDFTSNSLLVTIKNSVDGYFYYNDGWSKYWMAYDGNKEIPIHIANYNFKAVFLKKGTHTLRFVFDPKPYRIALFLYYAGLTSILATITFITVLNVYCDIVYKTKG